MLWANMLFLKERNINLWFIFVDFRCQNALNNCGNAPIVPKQLVFEPVSAILR